MKNLKYFYDGLKEIESRLKQLEQSLNLDELYNINYQFSKLMKEFDEFKDKAPLLGYLLV